MYTCIEAKNCYYVNLKLYIMTSSFYIKKYIYRIFKKFKGNEKEYMYVL